MGQELVILVENRFGHAIDAAKITAVCDGNAQIMDLALQGVPDGYCIGCNRRKVQGNVARTLRDQLNYSVCHVFESLALRGKLQLLSRSVFSLMVVIYLQIGRFCYWW